MFITIVVVLLLSLTYYLLPEEIQDKVVTWLKDTAKWAAICGVAVGILFAMIIFLPDALAEELPKGFYHKVVFIDEIEEQEEGLLIRTDDLDHLWDYWEDSEIEFEEFNKELSNIALWFVLENDLYAEFDKEEVLCKGRIIILTMWECDPNNPFDEEVVDAYYSEFVTDVEELEDD